MESLDHVVIGAGIHGAAVAYSLAGRAHQVRHLVEVAAMLNSIDTRVEVLTSSALWELAVGFDLEGIAAGAWEPDASYADPMGATQGLLERAVEEGVETRLYAAVVDLKAAEGEAPF